MEPTISAPLKKINPSYTPYTPEKVEVTKTLMLSPPYDDWDIKRFSIDPPAPLKIEGAPGNLFSCPTSYLYNVDGKPIKGRFRLEFPRDDPSMCFSSYGVMEITKELTEEQKKLEKEGKQVEREKTGKYQIRISIPAGTKICEKLRQIIDEAYAVAGLHLYKYGASDSGNKTFASKYLPTLERPNDSVGPDNAYESLKYPIHYHTKKVSTPNGIVDRPDMDLPGSIGAAVITPKVDKGNTEGKRQPGPGSYSKFVLDDCSELSLNEVTQRGFKHIPELGMSLFVGAKTKLKFTLANTIVTEWINSNAIGRLDAIEERRKAGQTTSESMKSRAIARDNLDIDKEKEEEERKAKEEAEALAKAKDEAIAQAKEEAIAQAKAEAIAQAKEEAKAEALAQAKAEALAEAKAQAKAEAAKARAEAKAKEEAKAEAEAAKSESRSKAKSKRKQKVELSSDEDSS